MRAVTFHGERTVRVETVPDPVIEVPTDALVRVRLAGVCGSDLHVYHDREDCDHGTVMGHEFVGEVVEVGKQVRGLRPGDRVLSPFTTSCGRCFYCRQGMTARCEQGSLFGWRRNGAGLQGGQAEYVRVPLAEGTLVGIPEGVEQEEGLLLGDVLSTGYFCARNGRVAPGSVVAVVGCGPVGLMAVVAARELGAQAVHAIDSIPERLALARSFGASTVDYGALEAVAAIREATEGRGADVVLEAVGSPAAGRMSMDLVRPGGTISVAGVHHEPDFAFSPADAYDKNLTFAVGRCPARAMLAETIPLVESKKYDVTSIVSHRMELDRGVDAYDVFDSKSDGCTKVVLRP